MREKRSQIGRINFFHLASIFGLLIILLLSVINKSSAQQVNQVETLTESEVVKIASRWFGMSSESVAEVMDVIFNEHGGPSAYIRGEEAGKLIATLPPFMSTAETKKNSPNIQFVKEIYQISSTM